MNVEHHVTMESQCPYFVRLLVPIDSKDGKKARMVSSAIAQVIAMNLFASLIPAR
jgi:hypothetical protein